VPTAICRTDLLQENPQSGRAVLDAYGRPLTALGRRMTLLHGVLLIDFAL
jgi:hypothetical protein